MTTSDRVANKRLGFGLKRYIHCVNIVLHPFLVDNLSCIKKIKLWLTLLLTAVLYVVYLSINQIRKH